jgi:hypothetical protein
MIFMLSFTKMGNLMFIISTFIVESGRTEVTNKQLANEPSKEKG